MRLWTMGFEAEKKSFATTNTRGHKKGKSDEVSVIPSRILSSCLP
jgi:hypothetical protein